MNSTMDYATHKKNLKDIYVGGKKVLLRVDLNVPLDSKLDVRDTTKIDAVMPTIQYLIEKGASVILMSHLGRPKGEIQERMRLIPVARVLESRLNVPVLYVKSTVGPEVERIVNSLKPGEVLLLENLRFNPQEERNDAEFAQKIASYGDIFVNDAFGSLHRSHASTTGIPRFLPAVSGLLVEKEIQYFSSIFQEPKRPFTVILGGAKVSTKISVLKKFLDTVDRILIGGGMCFTFLKALGYEIGNSLCENDKMDMAMEILKRSQIGGVELLLPVDVMVVPEITNNAPKQVVPVESIPKDMIGVDIGPATIELFEQKIQDSKTVLWNGPMGVFEIPRFANGTIEVAKKMAQLNDAITLIGGGESVMAANIAEVREKITHVSTGGGATLEFLEGKRLPGIEALLDKEIEKV
jgi:phosphoglycerate kinase